MAVSNSVQTVYVALDSVLIGPAERRNLKLLFNDPPGTVSLSELLDWVESFAEDEARQLITEGGKDGVTAFTATANRLQKLVAAAADKATKGPSRHDRWNLPIGYFEDRVKNAMVDVTDALEEVCRIRVSK